MNVSPRMALIGALAALVAACGGGGGGDGDATASAPAPSPSPSPAPSPSPSPAPAPAPATTITTSNYLDAYWIAGVAKIRLVGAAGLLDAAYDHVAAQFATSRNVGCPGGGSFTYAVSGNNRTMTFSNCDFGDQLPIVVRSGSIASSNAQVLDYTGTLGPKLYSGSFTLSSVVYSTTDTGSPGYGVDETANSPGFLYARQGIGALDVGVHGELAITRHGRTDGYTAIAAQIGVASGGSAPEVTRGEMLIATPRYMSALQSLGMIVDTGVTTALAQDKSRVEASAAGTSAQRYLVRSAAGAAPSLDVTLSNGDASVASAVAKALQ